MKANQRSRSFFESKVVSLSLDFQAKCSDIVYFLASDLLAVLLPLHKRR